MQFSWLMCTEASTQSHEDMVTDRGLYKLQVAKGAGTLGRMGAPVHALQHSILSQVELIDEDDVPLAHGGDKGPVNPLEGRPRRERSRLCRCQGSMHLCHSACATDIV